MSPEVRLRLGLHLHEERAPPQAADGLDCASDLLIAQLGGQALVGDDARASAARRACWIEGEQLLEQRPRRRPRRAARAACARASSSRPSLPCVRRALEQPRRRGPSRRGAPWQRTSASAASGARGSSAIAASRRRIGLVEVADLAEHAPHRGVRLGEPGAAAQRPGGARAPRRVHSPFWSSTDPSARRASARFGAAATACSAAARASSTPRAGEERRREPARAPCRRGSSDRRARAPRPARRARARGSWFSCQNFRYSWRARR